MSFNHKDLLEYAAEHLLTADSLMPHTTPLSKAVQVRRLHQKIEPYYDVECFNKKDRQDIIRMIISLDQDMVVCSYIRQFKTLEGLHNEPYCVTITDSLTTLFKLKKYIMFETSYKIELLQKFIDRLYDTNALAKDFTLAMLLKLALEEKINLKEGNTVYSRVISSPDDIRTFFSLQEEQCKDRFLSAIEKFFVSVSRDRPANRLPNIKSSSAKITRLPYLKKLSNIILTSFFPRRIKN